jgi:hypothetical protein
MTFLEQVRENSKNNTIEDLEELLESDSKKIRELIYKASLAGDWSVSISHKQYTNVSKLMYDLMFEGFTIRESSGFYDMISTISWKD